MAGAGSLIVITIDSWRADHAGFMGYGRPTTPFLDSLAGESFVFKNAVTAGAPTYYSLPGILASRYPLAPGRDLLGLAPEESTIASVLQEAGFATAGFSAANPYLSARFGYDCGFDVFRDFLDSGAVEFACEQGVEALPRAKPGLRSRANQMLSRACHRLGPVGAAYDELYFQYCQKASAGESWDALRRFPAADVIVDHAIAWLNEDSDRPFFLWLHLMDPHAPYYPKREALELMGDGELGASEGRYVNSYWGRGDLTAKCLQKKRDEVIALYDAGVRWADEQVRRLTERLVDLNLWDKCALAVTADHGEEFLEHGGRFHPPLRLSEELVHVPLLVRVPDSRGRNVEPPLGLIDLAPTLLDILGTPAPADFRGRSCWRQLSENATWERTVVTECVKGCTNPFRPENRVGPRILAVRKGNHKLVVDFEAAGGEELFDLEADPREENPLPADAEKAVRRVLLELARKHVVESCKARDFDRRMGSQLRELRIEWAHSASSVPN